ncbi:MAG: M20/M25/M40 family metallo-hydrolase, partial [Longimicrobiales bacterium]
MHSTIIAATAALLLTAGGPLAAQDLTADERRIVDGVEANQEEAIALLEQIVNINSGTLNAAGVRAVYDVLAPRFEALGFEVRYVENPAVANRGGHLVATRNGGQGKHLLLIGHLDTVFEEDSPFQQWQMVNDSVARGPGASDMKGGDVVMWSALEALH